MSDPTKSEHAERRGESEEERLDRNLMELLQELRVASLGVQFLFAFLLVVPFQQGWADGDRVREDASTSSPCCSPPPPAICLMAPVARHRIRFRDLDKKWIVDSLDTSTRSSAWSSSALAIGGVIMLISHVVFDSTLWPRWSTTASLGR